MEWLNLILPGLTKVLDRVIPDANARAQAQDDITKLLIQSRDKVFESMKDVMVADAQSNNKYTSAARPTVVYWSLAMISFIAGAGLFGHADAVITALQGVPSQLWTLMQIGIGGYVAVRGVEKAVNTVLSKRK